MIDVNKISQALFDFSRPLRKANWKVILLCFSTAATFWFFNALNKVYTTRVAYPIELVYNQDSLVMVQEPPSEITINVTGGGWQLFKRTISLNSDPVFLNPENPVQTQYFTSVNLLSIFSDQLSDLNVNYVATDTVFFKIEPYADRKLAIRLDSSSIKLKDNYFRTSHLFLEPDSVNFHGPESLINKLPEVFVVSLSEKDIDGNYDEELSLDLYSAPLIKKKPELIHVWFDVEEFVEQTVPLNIEMVNFPYDSSIYIQQNRVEASFKIQRSFRNKMKVDDFLIIADLNNMHTADSTITLEAMNFPEYVKDVVFLDNRVKVVYAK